MLIPVVVGDIDPSAVEQLITLCVEYARVRGDAHRGDTESTGTPHGTDVDVTAGPAGPDASATEDAGPGQDASGDAGPGAGTAAQVLAMLEHQILAAVIQIVSGPGGVASFLRRHLLGKGLNGPSLPLDVGQTDDIPVHLRRLVALRDQGCGYPGGCDQPASACEPHHVIHRADGGPTSLVNLKGGCHWHHHVLLHQLGWQLTVHPDGTSQARSPAGQDHPQPQPATPARVTRPAARKAAPSLSGRVLATRDVDRRITRSSWSERPRPEQRHPRGRWDAGPAAAVSRRPRRSHAFAIKMHRDSGYITRAQATPAIANQDELVQIRS